MEHIKIIEEKLRRTEKDIDDMRKEIGNIDAEVRNISNMIATICARQEEINEDIKTFNTNGGAPRCHERQIIIENFARAHDMLIGDIKEIRRNIDTLQTSFALIVQKHQGFFDIQKWTLELFKAIVVGVVIAAIVSQLGPSSEKKTQRPEIHPSQSHEKN